MDIDKLIKAVMVDAKARDHEAVLNGLMTRLLPGKIVSPASRPFCDLKDHESFGGVLAGTGGAIFHCLSEDVLDTSIALAVLKNGVPAQSGAQGARHASGRGESIRIFFLIISPIKESGTHLQILSILEGLLLDKTFHHWVLSARTEKDARLAVKRTLSSSRPAYMPLSKSEIFKELRTDEGGLSDEEAGRRLGEAGPNALKKAAKTGLLKNLVDNLFLNLFALLLWTGGMLAFLSGTPELGWAIFLVIIINGLFSFWQEYKAERAVEALNRLLPKKVIVTRSGKQKEIDLSVVVPGDLVMLAEGRSIPADGRLITSDDLRVDNSALTGESRPIYKMSDPLQNGKNFIWTEVPNLVFAGTSVLSGAGAMIVTATGMDTEIGKVAYLTGAIKTELSPLQKEMAKITKAVTLIAVSLGAVFFLLGKAVAGLTFAESFIFAIGIIVANVPEGLLPTVSLALAMGVQRMANKNAIVKKLSAVETLGSATVICTDKTGTLTTNQMCVKRLFVNDTGIDVSGNDYEPVGGFFKGNRRLDAEDIKGMNITGLLSAAALCNNASLNPPEPGKAKPYWSVSGDPTEGALLTATEKAGISVAGLRSGNPRQTHFPFERIRKRMSVIVEAGRPGCLTAFVKGAPNETLALCSRIRLGNGSVHLTKEQAGRILEENDAMASLGLRVLAVAARDAIPGAPMTMTDVERDLTFIGLIGMLDPPRPEVKDAITACKSAGIKVVVATGDYGLTAKAVAAEIGLGASRVVTGQELGAIGNEALKKMLKEEDVIFARVAPKDKLRVVTALQENKEVVAVTGDGVNDAPALKKADIGIAMGMRGSDAAKESAEIILTDDNFATIVEAIKEGRAIYSNIKRFVTYIFASNIPEMVPFIAFVIFKIPLPLTVMQILAVDLGTDVLPALGLAVEPPEKGIMNQPPRPRDKRLLDLKTLSRAYLFLGPLEAAMCLTGFFFAYWLRGWTPGMTLSNSGMTYVAATTMSFAGIVAGQVGNVFACRTEIQSVFSKGIFSNRLVIFGVVAELSLLLILTYTPFLQGIFGFEPLTLRDWAFLSAFPLVMLAASEMRKALIRRSGRPNSL